ncbi:hypothetical protein DFP72DRAFT_888007 [Ephemerocybe angulata]|uniref:Uncharacterized protein n=1 Tax=Ephemerocybe angulata TaxID=980116 RepID=A0A8H6I4H4_9AGAR|nr:hypothetical protein DFP72DRAFT_888007 [Tulosesus angulatus]
MTTMWGTKWSVAKALFFLSRYLAFLDVPFAVYFHTTSGLTGKTCHVMFVSVTSSILVGIALAEAILFLRVWAISGRDRILSIYLIFHFTAVHLVQAVLFGLFIGSLEFGPSSSPLPGIIGCFPLPPKSKTLNTLLSALFGLIVANELSILFITFVIGLRKFRDFRNPLIRVFYVDGFSYFLVLSAISTTNVVVDLVGPPEYRFLGLVVLQRVMHSILSTRMILHLRGAANDGTKPPTSNVQTGNSGEASRPLSAFLGRQSPMAVSTDLKRTVKRTASAFPGTLLEDIELSEQPSQLRKTSPEEPLCVPL